MVSKAERLIAVIIACIAIAIYFAIFLVPHFVLLNKHMQ